MRGRSSFSWRNLWGVHFDSLWLKGTGFRRMEPYNSPCGCIHGQRESCGGHSRVSAFSAPRSVGRGTGQNTAPVLRLRLLGHMAIDDSLGRVSLPRTRKARAILAILALSSPRPVLRLTLTALLWSQRQKEQARASLRQAIHELQDVLGAAWGRVLQAERHYLSLQGVGLTVDALGLGSEAARTAEAFRPFQNPLLEDLTGLDPAFDRWLTDERARLNRTVLGVGESLLAEQQDLPAALALAEQLLAIDRGHEGIWRATMRLHADSGDRTGALRVYERCRAALADADLAGPSPETEDLLARIGGGSDLPDRPREDPAATDDSVPVQVERRHGIRLGVMPLRLVDPAHPGHVDGLAMGLAEELTTSMARFRWISCVSGSSLHAIAGRMGTDLPSWNGIDADFVLDGTIQRGGPRVRVLMRIIDMRAGAEVVWARRFDREAADTLALQDDLVAEIVAQVEPELLMREGERDARGTSVTLSPNELVLRSIPAIYRLDREGFDAAGAMLERALAADPTHASGHAWYAYWHLFLVGQGWAADPEAASRRGKMLAERAVTLDPNDARALTLAGHVRGFLAKRPLEGLLLHERALALNPNLALAWTFSGLALSYLGRHEDALIRIRQASRMSPSDPHSFFFDNAMEIPYLLLGQYDKAVEFGRRAVELNPGFSSSYKIYLSALGHLGRHEDAADVRARLLALESDFSVSSAIARSPLTRAEDLTLYAEGLRRAGLPEQSGDGREESIDLFVAPQHSLLQRGKPAHEAGRQ